MELLNSWMIASALIVLAAIAGLYSAMSASPLYSSTAAVGLQAIEELNESEANPDALLASELAEATASDIVDIVTSSTGREIEVSISLDTDTESTIEFTSVSPTPELAADDANAVAETYAESRVQRTRSALEESLALLEVNRTALTSSAGLDEAVNATDITASAAQLAELNVLNERIVDIELALNSAESAARTVRPAKSPSEPNSNDLFTNTFLGALIGFGLAALYALARSITSQVIRSPRDIEDFALPFLGVMPLVKAESQIFLGNTSLPEAEAAISRLRLGLERRNQLGGTSQVLFTSPTSWGGTSTVAGNLAAELGRARRKTILLDGAFRRPDLHNVFGIAQTPGITDHINQGVSLAQVAQRAEGLSNSLIILPGGSDLESPQDLLLSERLEAFFKGLVQQADWVVMDAPPVLGHTDTLVHAKHGFSVVLLVRVGTTKRGDLREAVDALHSVGADILGLYVVGDRPEQWQELMGISAIDLTAQSDLATEKSFWGEINSKVSS